MNLFARLIRAIERLNLRAERRKLCAERHAIYRNDLSLVAACRLVAIDRRLSELGDKPRRAVPYIGEESVRMVRPMVEDDCGVPDGLVGEWRAPA